MVDSLFDEEILKDLEVNLFPNFAKKYVIRPLMPGDYDKGFLEVLTQLTTVGAISQKAFINRYNSMKKCPGTYYIVVIEDITKSIVIATGTLVIEQKFIRNCSQRGRIEDIVVLNEYRGNQFGKILMAVLSALAQRLKCYKVTLECKDKMLGYYESMGFLKEACNSNYLQKRL